MQETSQAEPMPSYPGNAAILLEAYQIVNGPRAREYGEPRDCFSRIAAYWSLYLRKEIKPTDVCYLMALLKMVREEQQHKADNLLDAAAYIALANDLQPEANF